MAAITGATFWAKLSAANDLPVSAFIRAKARRGFPRITPRSFAAAKAALVLEEMSARSFSAKAAVRRELRRNNAINGVQPCLDNCADNFRDRVGGLPIKGQRGLEGQKKKGTLGN